MHLIQILLPMYDNFGRAFAEGDYSTVRRELTDKFGGLTAFTRAPAQGLWNNEGETKHDDIVVFEVMTSEIDLSYPPRSGREMYSPPGLGQGSCHTTGARAELAVPDVLGLLRRQRRELSGPHSRRSLGRWPELVPQPAE